MDIEIRSDLKPPRGRGRSPIYPFDRMEVGQHFRIVGDEYKIDSVKVAACNYGKRHGMKFRTRKDDSGITVWRVE